ncbi:sugar ABC transporter ATP-binding protein [Salirhabdus salicampi]|uniref:sugar ABC transporter ATP-binding protein n=1 Tax=Salirhabdus salicampi TaxID=476102 RepID=UPI0020C2143A|nr:sugar ABC transporter ATP-binding protein [Salirhabdus salicampi]MCP8615669.1 sugar ABC transporter ATP-binding protein [Salirhabdus salicampi]
MSEESLFLEMKHVSKTYPGVKALENVELEVKSGEVHALVGENGAGKSTLIKVLAGIVQPDDGAVIRIENKEIDLHKTDAKEAQNHGISIIYQDLSLFPNLTVAENICIGKTEIAGFKKVNWNEIKKKAKDALSVLGVDIDLNLPLEKLSIARQQLVAIARALTLESKLIVMDEPTSSLSSGEVELLYKIIFDLKKKGIAILFVSHKMKELFTVADRFSVLRDGKFVGRYDKAELDEDKLISLMVGRNVEFEKFEAEEIGDTLLEAKNLSKKGNFKGINFTLRKGEVLGITGLVGSGRTELVQSIFGVEVPDEGEVQIMGKRINIKTPKDAVKHGIAYIPESRQTQGLILNQSIVHNISLPIINKLINKFKMIRKSKEKELAKQFVEQLDIRPPLPHLSAEQLSGGNQQKVVVGKWLSTDLKVLIVDEPTNGIDVGAKTEIHKLLRNLANEGIGVIMVSSELPEVLAVSDRVIVMRKGRIVDEVEAKGATQESIMNKALLGEAK